MGLWEWRDGGCEMKRNENGLNMRELRSRLKVERGKVTVVCSCEFCTV